MQMKNPSDILEIYNRLASHQHFVKKEEKRGFLIKKRRKRGI